MRRIINYAIGTLLFVLAGASAGLAQSAPPGSYQQTCRDIGVRGDVLTARCQDTGGNWRNAQMRDISYCNGDITNDNGALRCNSSAGTYQGSDDGGGYYNQGGIPGGSYTQTCQDVRIRGNDLEARCQSTDGGWRTTRLSSFDRCGGDIANANGNLRCTGSGYGYGGRRDDDDDRGYVGGHQGNNSYTQTCRDVRRRGDTLEAVCQSRDGDWHQTTLNDYRDCRGQIVNDGGNLRCDNSNYSNVGGWHGGYRGGIPRGSYAQTCQNVRASGDDLMASCQRGNGGWRDTKLDDYQGCRSDIVNDNGRLRCGR
ncbi:MAG TPA: CVNH domain-containing protein [Candidatus Binatia bacterium]|nr:CVNH domain-containing protein [Candidatus Binatia bacterium]